MSGSQFDDNEVSQAQMQHLTEQARRALAADYAILIVGKNNPDLEQMDCMTGVACPNGALVGNIMHTFAQACDALHSKLTGGLVRIFARTPDGDVSPDGNVTSFKMETYTREQ